MTTFHLEEMRCRRCVRRASAVLRDVPGVLTVTANSATGRITITGELDPSTALAALARVRFTVIGVDQQVGDEARQPKAQHDDAPAAPDLF